jgi:hypothetical protein
VRIARKLILDEKYDVMLRTGFKWLRIKSNVSLL